MKTRSERGVLSAGRRRLHVWWRGRVQGVGFRYSAETVALELRLVGWVRNLQDGRVEAVCEGSAPRLRQFLEAIRAGPMGAYVQTTQVQWEEPAGEFHDFHIRFS